MYVPLSPNPLMKMLRVFSPYQHVSFGFHDLGPLCRTADSFLVKFLPEYTRNLGNVWEVYTERVRDSHTTAMAPLRRRKFFKLTWQYKRYESCSVACDRRRE